jgi:cytochrome oxidase Cu insertion factor (SCO1/SenC/PrrC family)
LWWLPACLLLIGALIFAVHTWRQTLPRENIPVGRPLPELNLVDESGHPPSFLGHPTIFTFAFFHDAMHAPETLSEVRALAQSARVVTVTLVPEEDSPDHLRPVAATLEVAPPWSLVSGPPAEVTSLLEALDVDWPRLQSERARFGKPIFPETRAVLTDGEGRQRGEYDLSSWTERHRLLAELQRVR